MAWMRRQPKARTTKSKSRQEDFYKIKEAPADEKKIKIELKINMERMGSKIIELQFEKFGEKKVILENFSFDFQRGLGIGCG
jgi:ATP-binding cassette subfamily F protein uup